MKELDEAEVGTLRAAACVAVDAVNVAVTNDTLLVRVAWFSLTPE